MTDFGAKIRPIGEFRGARHGYLRHFGRAGLLREGGRWGVIRAALRAWLRIG